MIVRAAGGGQQRGAELCGGGAGPAQVIFFGAIMNGLALPAIALSVTLSSVRLTPMCVSLLPMLRRGDGPFSLRTFYCAHQIAVTIWVESMRRFPTLAPASRFGWFIGFGHTIYPVACLATAIGFFAAGMLPRPFAAGLLFVTPVYFTVALVRNARDMNDWVALGAGFVLAPLLRGAVGGGLDLLVVGLVGGTGAFLVNKWAKARARGATP